jgi:perosamine synthetase
VTHDTIKPCIGKLTKAVIAVALHGLPADIDPIRKLCGQQGIGVIEDCAQCLLGRYKDVFAGTKADFGCFSFERKKHLTTGSEGGMIVTNNEAFAVRARKFAGLGYAHMAASGGSTRVPEYHPGYLRFDAVGLNYRLSYAQAEIGLHKLKTVQDDVWRRQEIGYLWQHTVDAQCQPHNYDADNTFYSAAFPMSGPPLLSEMRLKDWKRFYDRFIAAGGDGFYAMPQVPYYEPALKDYIGLNPNPVAIDLQQRLMLFKTHYSLEEAKRQADILAEVLHAKDTSRPISADANS